MNYEIPKINRDAITERMARYLLSNTVMTDENGNDFRVMKDERIVIDDYEVYWIAPNGDWVLTNMTVQWALENSKRKDK